MLNVLIGCEYIYSIPFNGIRKRKVATAETRKKLSMKLKGIKRGPLSQSIKDKISMANKGRIMTEENKRKIGESGKGRILSEGTREKIRVKLKGIKRGPLSQSRKDRLSMVNKGRIVTKETRRKVSAGLKGRILSEDTREKIRVSHKGKPLSQAHLDAIKVANRKTGLRKRAGNYTEAEIEYYERQRLLIGEKSNSWKGGISFEPYDKNFSRNIKAYIRERDDYTCQKCGIRESEAKRKLTTHHINYDKLFSDDTNLIALCCRCNSSVNVHRDFWQTFFQDKLKVSGLCKSMIIYG